ncbi:MAG: acyl-CoA thioesterase II [Myxococcota bacterium]
MSIKKLEELIALLALERIEHNLFRGQSQDLGWGRVFGGQVAGQALSAAVQTVPEDRVCHSLHAYFLRGGDPKLPIVYEVDRIRDGKSFTTRRVVAVQKGQAIFNLAASFQIAEAGYEHQDTMPTVPGPEGLKSQLELAKAVEDKLPDVLKAIVLGDRPIEIRPIEPYNVMKPVARDPVNYAWYRTAGPLSDEPMLHQYMLAYASDFQLLGTALYPHGETWMRPGMQVASLDHAMWFHRPFRFDDWLLYAMESPSAAGARGFGRGSFYTRDGTLVASTVQEGLIRKRS